MSTLGKVVYLSAADYATLISTGTVTVGGVTITYSANDLYITPTEEVPSAYISNPAMDGTASPGSSGAWARGDHVHPTDTSRQAKITASGILKGDGSGGVSEAGAGTDYQAPLTAGTDYATPSAIPVSVVTNASTTLTLSPCPVTYKWGEVATLTLTVTATSQYHFMFSCPSGSATVLTLSGHTGTTGDTVEAGKTYEVDIWAGIALIRAVEVTAV